MALEDRREVRGPRHHGGLRGRLLCVLGIRGTLSLEPALSQSSTNTLCSTAQRNPDAAESTEAAELLSEDGAPYCFGADSQVLKCPVAAERTIRAGTYELEEWARLDRPYCSSDLFRQLILDNVTATEADCRTDIRERISKCNHEVCPQCVSPCNFPVARTVAQVFRCMDGTRHYGFLWFYQVSDAGQLARSMHGARRKDGYQPVPEKLAAVSGLRVYTTDPSAI